MNGWLIYDKHSIKRNKQFAEMLISAAKEKDINLSLVFNDELNYDLLPRFAIMRNYDYKISEKLEKKGVKVFNNSQVSKICNDKYDTYIYFKEKNIPLMETNLINQYDTPPFPFPFVLKPTDGHGGIGVTLISDINDYNECISNLKGKKIIAQNLASDFGKDLRVYIMGNKVIAAMLRTSEKDFRSNYSLGGSAACHILTREEKDIIKSVTDNMYFDFAGIDLIYNNNKPVLNEIEDVVGSRMLYNYTDIDVCKLYIEHIEKNMGLSQ